MMSACGEEPGTQRKGRRSYRVELTVGDLGVTETTQKKHLEGKKNPKLHQHL